MYFLVLNLHGSTHVYYIVEDLNDVPNEHRNVSSVNSFIHKSG